MAEDLIEDMDMIMTCVGGSIGWTENFYLCYTFLIPMLRVFGDTVINIDNIVFLSYALHKSDSHLFSLVHISYLLSIYFLFHKKNVPHK